MLRKRKGLWILMLLVIVAAGGGYYYYLHSQKVDAQTTGSDLQTARVRRGELVISATGAGTVISAETVDLGFGANGTVTSVKVKVGDVAQVGDVLASIDDVAARKAFVSAQLQVAQAQQSLLSAQSDYDDLVAGPTQADLLAAESAVQTAQSKLDDLKNSPTASDLATAQANLSSAKDAYDSLESGPTASAVEQAQMSLEKAKNSLWAAQMSRDAKGSDRDKSSGAYDQAQVSVYNAEIAVRQAEMDLAGLQEPATRAELEAAQAKVVAAEKALSDLRNSPTASDLAAAEADLAKAQQALDDLRAGPSEAEVTIAKSKISQAEISLQQAQLTLEDAQAGLADTDLVAPLAGTVMEMTIEVGERVTENTTVITVADLSRPLLDVYLDEADMEMFKMGYEADVVFNSLPDSTFVGHVTQVDPQLTTQSNVDVIHGQVELNADSFAKPQGLVPGMNATVDVIGGRAENAVLVPVEALRDLGDGQYAVFVMENGQPTMHLVEVGLQDYTYAEIKSGLDGGETVTTGIVETN